jgi:hypothetical protein
MDMFDNTFPSVATDNALSMIKEGSSLPDDVFETRWNHYLFFDSSYLFGANFITFKDLVLREEGATELALVNLNATRDGIHIAPQAIVLSPNTTFADYRSLLTQPQAEWDPWMVSLERYVSASEKPNWCIYSETHEDIAILALQDFFSPPAVQSIRARSTWKRRLGTGRSVYWKTSVR